MKYRANHQQNQHNLELHKIYLDNLLELEKEQQKLEQQRVKSSSSLVNSSNLASMKHKQLSNNVQISGLNNLGNSCFFNAILQNLAQTPYLEELLRENSTTQEKSFVVKHNDDYDSELTDFDEDDLSHSGVVSKSDATKIDHLHSDLDESSNEIELIRTKSPSENETTSSANRVHRSMRLNELTILLKEQSSATPGGSFLGKQLADLIKNMTNSTGTVNPSVLFGSVCKKIPSFKGFNQQDSHELLRNLLDAIKTEELKRRQAALLEIFGKANSLDEKSKMKIKRYGRLASYTHIDKLFGGHLLSSIVCEECNTCIQRVEPFLDLSLPISSGSSSSNNLTQAVATGDDLSDDAFSRRRTTRGSKKSLKNASTISTTNNTTNNTTEDSAKQQPLSKHMTKKQQKKAAKTAKRLKKQVKDKETAEEENPEKDSKEAQSSEATNDTNEKELTQAVNKLSLEEDTNNNTNKDESDSDDENPDLNSNPTNKTETNNKEIEDLRENDENHKESEDELKSDETKYKLENSFKLEAMKTLKQYQHQLSQESDTNGTTLQACLSRFTSNEILSDKLKCDTCTRKNHKINTYTKALKQYLICDLPAVLTIHLKRFQQHGYRLEKSNKHVQFPLVLDMSSYTSKMCINISREQRSHVEPVLYALYGLVEHSGRLNSGHYTAYVKSNRSKSKLKSWFLGNQRLCHLNAMLKKWNGQTIVDTNNNSLNKSGEEMNNSSNVDEETSTQATSLGEQQSNTNGSSASTGAESNSNDDQWFYISDSHVTEVNVSKVLKAQAYILFYERIE